MDNKKRTRLQKLDREKRLTELVDRFEVNRKKQKLEYGGLKESDTYLQRHPNVVLIDELIELAKLFRSIPPLTKLQGVTTKYEILSARADEPLYLDLRAPDKERKVLFPVKREYIPETGKTISYHSKAKPYTLGCYANEWFYPEYCEKRKLNVVSLSIAYVFRLWSSYPHDSTKEFKEAKAFVTTKGSKIKGYLVEINSAFKKLHGVDWKHTGHRDIRPFEFVCFVHDLEEVHYSKDAHCARLTLREQYRRKEQKFSPTKKEKSPRGTLLPFPVMKGLTLDEFDVKHNCLMVLLLYFRMARELMHSSKSVVKYWMLIREYLVGIISKLDEMVYSHTQGSLFDLLKPYLRFSWDSDNIGYESLPSEMFAPLEEDYSLMCELPNETRSNCKRKFGRLSERAQKCFRAAAKEYAKLPAVFSKMYPYFDEDGDDLLKPILDEISGHIQDAFSVVYTKQGPLRKNPDEIPSVTSLPRHICQHIVENLFQVIERPRKAKRRSKKDQVFESTEVFERKTNFKLNAEEMEKIPYDKYPEVLLTKIESEQFSLSIREADEKSTKTERRNVEDEDRPPGIEGVFSTIARKDGDLIGSMAGYLYAEDPLQFSSPYDVFGTLDIQRTVKEIGQYGIPIPFEKCTKIIRKKRECPSKYSFMLMPLEFSAFAVIRHHSSSPRKELGDNQTNKPATVRIHINANKDIHSLAIATSFELRACASFIRGDELILDNKIDFYTTEET